MYHGSWLTTYTQSRKQPRGARMGVDMLEVRGQLPAVLALHIGEVEFFCLFPKSAAQGVIKRRRRLQH